MRYHPRSEAEWDIAPFRGYAVLGRSAVIETRSGSRNKSLDCLEDIWGTLKVSKVPAIVNDNESSSGHSLGDMAGAGHRDKVLSAVNHERLCLARPQLLEKVVLGYVPGLILEAFPNRSGLDDLLRREVGAQSSHYPIEIIRLSERCAEVGSEIPGLGLDVPLDIRLGCSNGLHPRQTFRLYSLPMRSET